MTKLLICLVLAFWITPHVSSFLFDPNNNKIELPGPYAGANLGKSISAGDVNGDGFSDIMMVGMPPKNNCGYEDYCSGIVYILYGSKNNLFQVNFTNISASQGFTITAAKTKSRLGLSVSAAGDVNGDGIDDIVIGDPNELLGTRPFNRTAYVIFGKRGNRPNIDLNNTLSPTEGYRIFADYQSAYLGDAVSSAGDVNGDGIGDIILGASEAFYSNGGAYIIYGSKATPSDIDLKYLNRTQGISIKGADVLDHLGFAVSKAGDVNGDGFGDVVIGAYGADPGRRPGAGTVYVIFGGKNLSDVDTSYLQPSEGITIKGQTKLDSLGWSVSAAGDINGGGVDDIIIGADGASPTYIHLAGASYVIFGKTDLTDIDLLNDFGDFEIPNIKTGFRIVGPQEAELGYAVAGVGDVNGDGIDDVLVGVDRNNENTGSVYVIFGSRNECFGIDTSKLDSKQGVLIMGDNPGDFFGWSVANAGDVNGDGVNDLIVGAAGAGNEFAGAVYVMLSQVGSDVITE